MEWKEGKGQMMNNNNNDNDDDDDEFFFLLLFSFRFVTSQRKENQNLKQKQKYVLHTQIHTRENARVHTKTQKSVRMKLKESRKELRCRPNNLCNKNWKNGRDFVHTRHTRNGLLVTPNNNNLRLSTNRKECATNEQMLACHGYERWWVGSDWLKLHIDGDEMCIQLKRVDTLRSTVYTVWNIPLAEDECASPTRNEELIKCIKDVI